MEEKQLEKFWQAALVEVAINLAPGAIERWLKPLIPVSFENNILNLRTDNPVIRKFFEDKYKDFTIDACREAARKLDFVDTEPEKISIKLNYVEPAPEPVPAPAPIPEEKPKQESPQGELDFGQGQEASGRSETFTKVAPGDASSLNPKYVFDNFVTGSFNRIAHAAALAVAKEPGKTYNPLFMYGGVGLGKTHLMHAIGHEVLKNDPTKRVLYITCEKFTNELINAIRDNSTEAFRQKYRHIDLLMVDDVQFLTKKIQTQEEFFHTFNALYQSNKAIVLSSDRPPHEIQTLEERLKSRFASGLLADIQAPDLETRIAILKKKAMLEQLDVPNEALIYIAGRIDNNIRELEGALTRVVAYASLTGSRITTELVAESLKNIFPDNTTKEITLEIIREVVATHFKITIEDLNSGKRNKNLAMPRQIAMYLCRELTDTSLPQIGEFFGGRDHTTVLHAYKKIAKDRASNIQLDKTVQELIKSIEKM